MTPDEVNRLAVTRFLNYQAGGRAVTITVPNVTGGLVVTGSIDYRTHTGYGVVRGSGRDTSSNGLIQWTAGTVLVHPLADPPATAPASPPAAGWYSRPMQASGMTLDSALAIALDLGSDRPDNSALLPQNGAAWVGREVVRGHRTDIMKGPEAEGGSGAASDSGGGAGGGAGADSGGGAGSEGGADLDSRDGESGDPTPRTPSQTVRYWIGPDGTMYRVEAAIASAPEPVLFDFDTQPYVPVQPLPGATPAS